MESTLKKLKISRASKYDVGKKMGSKIWIHKDFVTSILPSEVYNEYKTLIPTDFDFSVLRWDEKLNELAFIECIDFNNSNEPIVGKVLRVIKDGDHLTVMNIQNPPKDPLIYHHKWLFVKDNYKGFNVDKSKERSIEWKKHLGVNKEISNKIGRLSFWEQWLLENNLNKRTEG